MKAITGASALGLSVEEWATELVSGSMAPSLGNYMEEQGKNARLSELYRIWGGEEKCYLQ